VDPTYDARPEARLSALRGLVTEIVDFRKAAAVALGPEWSARTSAEHDEFVRLFTDLLETSVFASVGARARIDRGITVRYLDETKDGDATAVTTTVLTRSGREMTVGYRMGQRQDGWVVQDLVVDGVSLVENYRAQFQKFMQRSSYTGLVDEMRARIADMGRTPVLAAATKRPGATATAATPIVTPAASAMASTPVVTPAASSSVATPVVTATSSPMAVAPAVPADSRVNAPAMPESVIVAAVIPSDVATTPTPRSELRTPLSARPSTRIDQFWVQVGAFRSSEKAMQVATALRGETVSLFAAPDTPLLRVVVGPFANREAATSKLREIRARGYDAFIATN
jgi:phospholipid transport system substrate-binding protein